MKYRIGCVLLPALMLLSGCTVSEKSPLSQQTTTLPTQEPEIEFTISNYKYLVMKASGRIGKATTITVHNDDNVTHGFMPTFNGRALHAEGEGQRIVVNGLEGFHIDPDTSLTVRVILESEGIIHFGCDVHPNMNGETLSISNRRTVKSPKQ